MNVGRNAPCPCGSGKKYKKCCLSSGRFERPVVHGDVEAEAAVVAAGRRADTWEVGFLPVPISVGEDPDARPTVAFVMAEGLVLQTELMMTLSVELDDLTRALVHHVGLAIQRVGGQPRAVCLDDDEWVEALGSQLPAPLNDVAVEWGSVDGVEEAWSALCAEAFDIEAERAAITRTWRAWGQPDTWVVAMFEVGERFYRCRPWQHFEGEELLIVEPTDGDALGVSVMGAAGETYGMMLTDEPEVFLDDIEAVRFIGQAPVGELLSFTFVSGSDAPPEARREIKRLRLPVAGPAAYPVLYAIQTRAGGLPRSSAERLLRVLLAVTELFEQEAEVREALSGEGWHSPDGAFRITLTAAPDPFEVWPGVLDLERLRPGATTGPEADPQACSVFTGRSTAGPESYFDFVPYENEFEQALLASGLKENTVEKHVMNAGLWLRYLSEWVGVGLEAVHEFDLRTFLYEWYPRKALATKTEARSMLTSIRRFLAHIESVRGLRFPWAAPLLADRETFMQRWEGVEPGPFWNSGIQDWQVPFYEHLRALALLPSGTLGEDDEWGATMGIRESELSSELQRHWLHWREEMIEAGQIIVLEILPQLVQRQEEWELSPHPKHDSATPYELILEERREMAARS